MICDSSDLAPECANPHETRIAPERILLYDQRPGGTGVSMRVRDIKTFSLFILSIIINYAAKMSPLKMDCKNERCCKLEYILSPVDILFDRGG